MLYPNDPMFFPQPSTNDRKDELNVNRDDMILFKSPASTTISISKKRFKRSIR